MTMARHIPDPTLLGTVEDVTGPRVSVKLAEETAHGLLFIRGEGYRVGQVGSFVRIPAGYVDLYGIVAQVGAGAAPTPKGVPSDGGVPRDVTAANGSRWLRVELVGEGRRGEKFERGISQYPSIGDAVHIVTESDLHTVYAPGDAGAHVAIGRVASSEGIPAFLDINRLLSRHCAIVGSTGSGKSTAVASLLGAIADQTRFPAARVILLDLHGEYGPAFGEQARVFRINADAGKGERELYIPFWALNSDELMAVTMGNLSSTIGGPILERMVAMKRASKPGGIDHGIPPGSITADTPLPFCIQKLWYDLHCQHFGTHKVGPNQNQSEATRAWMKDATDEDQVGEAMTVQRPGFRPLKDVKEDPDKIYKSAQADQPKGHVESLEVKLRDPRMKFLFEPGEWSVQPNGTTGADLDSLLNSWIGLDAPISVFDLSGIPTTVLDDLVGALLRILFDSSFWGRRKPEGTRARPLLVVLEEAHLYLGEQSKSRAAPAARRIAKEGRKYGVGLMIVSQRPSEIDSTILSQCGTIIALRLTNDRDRGQIRACSSDNLEGLFAMLPILRTGEALIVGESVSMPMRALVNLPPQNRRPESEDPLVVVPLGKNGKRVHAGGWTDRAKSENYKVLIEAWRREDANVSSEQDKSTKLPAGKKKQKSNGP